MHFLWWEEEDFPIENKKHEAFQTTPQNHDAQSLKGSLTSERTPDNCQETRAESRRGREVCKKLLAGDRKFSKLQLKIAISYG